METADKTGNDPEANPYSLDLGDTEKADWVELGFSRGLSTNSPRGQKAREEREKFESVGAIFGQPLIDIEQIKAVRTAQEFLVANSGENAFGLLRSIYSKLGGFYDKVVNGRRRDDLGGTYYVNVEYVQGLREMHRELRLLLDRFMDDFVFANGSGEEAGILAPICHKLQGFEKKIGEIMKSVEIVKVGLFSRGTYKVEYTDDRADADTDRLKFLMDELREECWRLFGTYSVAKHSPDKESPVCWMNALAMAGGFNNDLMSYAELPVDDGDREIYLKELYPDSLFPCDESGDVVAQPEIRIPGDKEIIAFSGVEGAGTTTVATSLVRAFVQNQVGGQIFAAKGSKLPIVNGMVVSESVESGDFDAGLRELAEVLEKAKKGSVVLLDDFLGFIDNDQVLEEDVMAMATMILGGFTEKGCRVVVTTHDPSVLCAIVNMEAAIVFGKKTVDEGPASYEFVEGIEEIDSSEYGRRAAALCGKLFS